MDVVSESTTEQVSSTTWSWKDLLIIMAGIVGIFVIVTLILFLLVMLGTVSLEQLTEPTFTQSLALATLEAMALIGGVYFFGIKRKGYKWDSVGLRPAPWYWLAIAGIATLIVIPIVSLITLAVLLASGQSLENPQLDFLLPGDLTVLNAIYMLILAGIVAPFAEELLFRGVLYSLMRQKWSIFLSVFLSSLIFGLIHGNLAVGLTGFFMGIVAALVFEYSNSLWTSFIVHAVNNSARIALLYMLYMVFGDSLTL